MEKGPAIPLNALTNHLRAKRVAGAMMMALMLVGSLAGAEKSPAPGTVFEYPDFSRVGNLSINGNATVEATADGRVLQLTPALALQAGTAFQTQPVDIQSFSTVFSFRMMPPGGADGLAFVIQTHAPTFTGNFGGYYAYANVPGPSVAVEFDTFQNTEPWINDPDGNHVGVNVNGNVNSVATAPVATPMNNGNWWYAWIHYNGTTKVLEVSVNETGVPPAAPDLVYTGLDIPAILGRTDGLVGLTAGTGVAFQGHQVRSWAYANPPPPEPVAAATATALTDEISPESRRIITTAILAVVVLVGYAAFTICLMRKHGKTPPRE